VHIVGLTTTDDVDPPHGASVLGPTILPGTELTSTGAVAVDNGHQNLTPESQAKSRPEFTVTNMPFLVQPGYMILLENSIDTSVPEAGPPPGKGVSGVPSATEFGRVVDWSDIGVFANITDSTGTHGVAYWCSSAENTGNQDTGTPLDTLLTNIGSSNPGLAAPKSTDNVVFLIEREAGRSGDNNPSQLKGGKGGGQSNPNNSYLTNNITYNTHTDPPAAPSMVFTGALTNTVTVNAANESAAEMNDHATATITITTAGTSVLPDVNVIKLPDQTNVAPGATAGFTVLIYNQGGDTATGVTLSDPLPPGANNDINWSIDTSTGNFASFSIGGAVGHQTLSLNSGTSLAPGAHLIVHITGKTGAADTGRLTNVATVNASNEAAGDQNATGSADITVGAIIAGSAILNDTADLEGLVNPTTTGTIAFTLYAPDNSVAFTQTVTVNHGNGLYSTSNTAVATQAGTYQWVVVYSGDANNAKVTSGMGSEPVAVTGSPDVDALKTADQATIIAGAQAGFTITVKNEGNVAATGVTLTDPLPAGAGNDINWMIDMSGTGLGAGTTPSAFVITGSVGSQVLKLAGQPISLASGATLSVHITGLTSAQDVSALVVAATQAPAILPGTELTSAGAVAADNGHQNVTPESQAKSRPEITVTNLAFLVQPGYMILLESTIDTTIPEAGPTPRQRRGRRALPHRIRSCSGLERFRSIRQHHG
jgi:uncharacterized repeat protein (TIGR01451 family)